MNEFTAPTPDPEFLRQFNLLAKQIEGKATELDQMKTKLDVMQRIIDGYTMLASDSPALQIPSAKKEIKRIRSTEMVANLVNVSSRDWTRDQIHAAFKATYGIPEGWENPVQALNNAIGRAVEKGLIRESEGLYSPGK